MFPSWFDIVRFEEVVVFTCGLMDDASPLVNYVYQSFRDDQNRQTRKDQRIERNQLKSRLKRLGKNLENTELFRLLYSESVVQLPGFPLQNHYINWFDHNYDDQNGIPRNVSTVHIPSKHHEFRNLKEKLWDFKLSTSHHDEKIECSVSIVAPHSEVTASILSMCCEISQNQEITHLWIEHVEHQHVKDDMKLRLSPNALSLYVRDCKLPQKLTCQLLTQLSICNRIAKIWIYKLFLGDLAHFIPKAILSWDTPLLEELYLMNCSIPEDTWCEILKSLATCTQISVLDLSGNNFGTSGKYLADTINNWGDGLPLKELYLEHCSIPEESCSELLKSLATCQHITYLSLNGNHIGASGKHLADAIKYWTDSPSLQELYLNNCSIPEDSCCEILKSLATCQHITHLSLNGNHIGASGKYLADAISNWGDAPSLELLYLENCSIPEDSCSEILKSLATCQHITKLSLSGNHIRASGKYLADAISNWGDAPSLELLYLENCSIPEDSCSEILKSLATCQHITHLCLNRNHIGGSGKHLADAINSWGDAPSLEELYLKNCSMPKEGCCEILKSIRTLIKHKRLQKLSKLVLNANNLQLIEDEVGELLKTCLSEHQQKLTLFLEGNKFSKQFVNHWKKFCTGTHLTPVFDDDDDDSWITTDDDDDATVRTSETQRGSSEHDTDHLMIESIKINKSSISFQKSHGPMYTPSNMDVQALFSTLFKCSSLRMLSSEGVSLGNDVTHIIKAIHVWGPKPLLQELSLLDSNITEDSCGPLLKALSSCHQLVHLSLAGNRIGIHGFHLADTINTWGPNPKLKTLDLTDCSMPSSVCGALLFALGKCKNLTDLWLPGNILTGCMHHFLSDPSQGLPSLEELFLSYTNIRKTEGLPLLKELFLSHTELDERDVVHLVQLIQRQKVPQLGQLGLCGNNLHRMEETIVDVVQALVTHHQRRLKLYIWCNYLSVPLHKRLLSICLNKHIELSFRPTVFDNLSGRKGSTSSSLEEYSLKLHQTFGDPSLRPTSALWKDEDLLEGFL